MNVLRDKNGVVCVDEKAELSAEYRKDMERLPVVVDELTDQMFRETPTVAVSACITVLSRVLLAGGDPMNEARIIGEALQMIVRQHLEGLQGCRRIN
jgi:hypothetical protein